MAKAKLEGSAPTKARVLTQTRIGDKDYKPNDIVSAAASVIASLESQGAVDSDSDAVAYAESLKAAE